jgi:hypothetical protein
MATPSQASAFALEAGARPTSLGKFLGYVILAGLGNAFIAAFLLFRLPADHAPSLHSLLIRSVIYVSGAVLAGAAGSRFYWNRFSVPFRTDPPLSFPQFAIVNAGAWVWVPAVVLLSREDSPGSAILFALGAALLANGLRRIVVSEARPRNQQSITHPSDANGMFAATLRTPHRDADGYAIALCVYATGYLLINHFYLTAGVSLAAAAFLFEWKLTLEPQSELPGNLARRRQAGRFYEIALAAILVTLYVMLHGIGHRNDVEAGRVAFSAGGGKGDNAAVNHRRPGSVYVAGISGYQSIILWPVLQKPKIAAPVLASVSPFAKLAAKPLVIKFDGPYWYFQPPGQKPGPQAYEAHGNPLTANIEANNFLPLKMEAVQNLGSPIRLARCREVQVTVENRDNVRGMIAVGVVLADASAADKPTVSLGEQTILSSQPDQFAVKLAPVYEVLRFAVPDSAALRKFNQITVDYYSGPEHWQLGARVAIDQFELIPR